MAGENKYIDLAGLTEFKNQFQTKLVGSTSSWIVSKANADKDGNEFSATYLKQAEEFVKATKKDSKISVTDGVIDVDLSGKVDKVTGYGLSKNDFTDALKTKLDGIADGAEVNVLEVVKLNGTELEITDKAVNLTAATGSANGTIAIGGSDIAVKGLAAAAYLGVENDCLSTTSGVNVLDAYQGKVLADRISALEGVGRFLSTWNMATGLPGDDPTTSPYAYKAGDYYIVNVIPSTGNKLKPYGDSYTKGTASTAVESGTVSLGDFYFYTNASSGDKWKLVHYDAKDVPFTSITGSPYDNTNLASALNDKVSVSAKVNNKAFSTTTGEIVLNGADIKLDGYAKASASAAISTTDTVNAAFGKLEYKVDQCVAGGIIDAVVTMPENLFTVNHTLEDNVATNAVSYKNVGAMEVFAGPITGGDDAPAFRALEATDIPELAQSKITNLTTDLAAKVPQSRTIAGKALDADITAAALRTALNVSDGANKVESSTTNGNIKVDGSEVTVYTHPATTAVAAAFKKVGNDALGHVVLGDAIVKKDLTDLILAVTTTANDLGLMTAADKSKLDGIAAGAQVNVIETIKVNDQAQSVSGKAVNLTIHNVPAGGAADYVLQKASATDYDLKWAAIPSAPIQKVKVNGTELGISESAVDILIASGTANGNIKVNNVDVAVTGLKSAAFTESTAYDAAGTAQGLINGLDATVNQEAFPAEGTATGLALTVVETDGKLTSVSGSIATASTSEIDALFS